MRLYYSAARFSILTPAYEGFWLPGLESLACGTPVIAPRHSSIPEVVGDAGILVDGWEEEEWFAAMDRLWAANDRSYWAEKGIERARQFSWDQAAKENVAGLPQRIIPSKRIIMKIVFIEPAGAGGIAHCTYALAKALGEQGAQCAVLTGVKWEERPLPESVHVHRLFNGKKTNPLRLWRQCYSWRSWADIVHWQTATYPPVDAVVHAPESHAARSLDLYGSQRSAA
jgi:glycosyltransferase involved in cell wall biosynthesis